jgi:carbon monoxide dehydrogenase subunit G
MRLTGRFTTTAGVAALTAIRAKPEKLSGVPTLHDIHLGADGAVHALFTPATSFGRFPIAVRIVPEATSDDGVQLRVHGRYGQSVVDVRIDLAFEAGDAGPVVNWDADLIVRGPAASIGQRVARDVAGRAIADVLESAAAQM